MTAEIIQFSEHVRKSDCVVEAEALLELCKSGVITSLAWVGTGKQHSICFAEVTDVDQLFTIGGLLQRLRYRLDQLGADL